MGYFSTTDPKNAVPAKSLVSPKTHVPGSRLEERGQRFHSPGLGRWVSRDPIEDFVAAIGSLSGRFPSGLIDNLYCFCNNSGIMKVDVKGLYSLTNLRRRCQSPCMVEDVMKEGCKAGKEGFDMGTNLPFPADAVQPGSAKPEFGGRICCNIRTKMTGHTGPIQGTWTKQYAGTVGGSVMYIYGYGIASVDVMSAPPCSSLGEDWAESGVYHTHPFGSNFSQTDKNNAMGRDVPSFLFCNGTCKVLDPYEGKYIDGATVIDVLPVLRECSVNPATGSLSCSGSPILPF